MFKKLVFLGPIVAAILLVGNIFGLDPGSKDTKLKQLKISKSAMDRAVKYADFAEFWLIITPYTGGGTPEETSETILLRKVGKLEEFIKRKPRSFLADDARLGMAEIYHSLAEQIKKDRGQQDLNAELSKNWMAKANEQLIYLVANHRNGLYFNVFEGVETKEPTAALALYYLGVWNNNLYFLEQLAEEYPDSKIGREVKSKLKSPNK